MKPSLSGAIAFLLSPMLALLILGCGPQEANQQSYSAYARGVRAYHAGLESDAAPYGKYHDDYADWVDGWMDAKIGLQPLPTIEGDETHIRIEITKDR